jgi:hypothetical protein
VKSLDGKSGKVKVSFKTGHLGGLLRPLKVETARREDTRKEVHVTGSLA